MSAFLYSTLKKFMPQGKHLRGVGPKEQREYEHIKESAKKSGAVWGSSRRSRGSHGNEAP
jgi:hypothetical protein